MIELEKIIYAFFFFFTNQKHISQIPSTLKKYVYMLF